MTYVVHWLCVRCVTFVYYVEVLVVAIYLAVCLYVCWLVVLLVVDAAWYCLVVCLYGGIYLLLRFFDDGLYLMLVGCCLVSFWLVWWCWTLCLLAANLI